MIIPAILFAEHRFIEIYLYILILLITYFVGYTISSSNHKKTIRQLIEENKFLNAVINSIPEPVIAIDEDDNIRVLNYATEIISGEKLTNELTTSKLFQSLQLDHQSNIPFHPGKPDTSSITIETGGELKVYQRNIIRIKNENQSRIGCLIHYHDYTEADEAIKKSQTLSTRYADSFSNSPAAMALIRIADGKLIDCNHSFQTLTGYNKEAFDNGAHVTKKLFHSGGQLQEILQLVRDNRQLYNLELPLINANGNTCITLGSFEAIESGSQNCMFATFIDITDWKKTEQALIDSENFAYSALDSLGNMIAVLDNTATLLYTNTSWKNTCTSLFNLSNCCDHGTDLIHEWDSTTEPINDSVVMLKDNICKVASGITTKISYEFSNLTNNQLNSYNCKISRFLHGKQARIMISIEDISDLRKAEYEKRKTENKYKSIFKNLTEGIFQCDNEGKLITVNPAIVRILGITGEEDSSNDACYLSSILRYKKGNDHFLQQLHSEEAAKGIIFDVSVVENQPLQILLKARTISYEGNSYIEGTIEDITERITAENALRNSEFTLRTIFDNAIQSFILLDPNYRILKWNQKAEDTIKKITGQQIATGDAINRYLPKKFLNGFNELIEEVGTSKQLNRQFKFREINGTESWVDIYMCTYESDYGKTGYIITATDITNAKLASEKINSQISMLQKTNLELDRFVYSVTHDLRAPLTSILGVINIAMYESSTPGMIKHLDMMKDCVHRLDEFIQNILNHSRNSRQGLCISEISFRQLLAESRNNLKYLNGEDRIRMVSTINENEPFYSDATRISVLLNNLLSNAVKYSDPNKPDSYIEVNINTTSSGCEIQIKDNGIGIAAEHQHKVFEMFYRIYQNVPGSGIGLYIVKETINKLKGTIELTSEKDKGSIFLIQLPDLSKKMIYKRQTNEIEN